MSGLPKSTSTLLKARRQKLKSIGSPIIDNIRSKFEEDDEDDLWIITSPRRSSIARISMMMQSLPAYFIYNSENGAEQRIDLTKTKYKIGRKHDKDIVLKCPQISKYHADIEKTDKGWILRDHNSANGTFVNEMQINGEHLLKDRDKINVGSVLLEFFDEIEITDDNWQELVHNHPAFSSELGEKIMREASTQKFTDKSPLSRQSSTSAVKKRPSTQVSRRHHQADKNLSLVTILPSEKKYEESLCVKAEMSGVDDAHDFVSAKSVSDPETLRNDYEKLRLAYELSKMGLTDVDELLEKMLDLMFEVLPVDRGVVLLVDHQTGMLTTDKVRLREGKGQENREILLSYTVLQKVYKSKRFLITSDAFEDPLLGKAASIAKGKIRSVICVPLIAHDQVHGILHLDSQDRINAFAEKDLSLVKAISNQAAIALENCQLLKDIEKEISIRENLGRCLPPHVVEQVLTDGDEPLRKSGRQALGTILFADIRGFTQLSEKIPATEVVELLNDFFERLVQIVFKYDGVLDKYIGDGLMAGFGTLPGQENAEYNAVCAALEFMAAIEEMNKERKSKGRIPIAIGVGINTGPIVAGYIGSSQRLEYTSIGDTVNTASRLCSLAKPRQILISETTFEAVGDFLEVNYQGNKRFKGKTKDIAVYAVDGIKPEDT